MCRDALRQRCLSSDLRDSIFFRAGLALQKRRCHGAFGFFLPCRNEKMTPYAWRWTWSEADGELGAAVLEMRACASRVAAAVLLLEPSATAAPAGPSEFMAALARELEALDRPELAAAVEALRAARCDADGARALAAAAREPLARLRRLRRDLDVLYPDIGR